MSLNRQKTSVSGVSTLILFLLTAILLEKGMVGLLPYYWGWSLVPCLLLSILFLHKRR